MDAAARTPPDEAPGLPWTALALLAGVGACLCLPALPPWPWLAAGFACGLGLGLRGPRTRCAGALLLGFGLAGLHAAATLAQQLPVALEHDTVTVSGRVLDLPRHEPRRTRFLFVVDADAAKPAALRGQRLRLAWYDDYDRPTGRPPRLALQAGSRWRLHARRRASSRQRLPACSASRGGRPAGRS